MKRDRAWREAVKVAEHLDFVSVATPYVVAAIARAIRRETRRCLRAIGNCGQHGIGAVISEIKRERQSRAREGRTRCR